MKKKKKITTLEDVMKTIKKWSDDNEVVFFGSFTSFDEKKIVENAKDVIKEDRYICYGHKKLLKLSLDEFVEYFKKANEEYINW